MTAHPFSTRYAAATLSLALLVGCSQPLPTTPHLPTATSRTSTNAVPMSTVQPTALQGIQDAGKQQTAAALTNTMGVDLRAQATLRDAELLDTGAGPVAYALLDDGGDRAASGTAKASGDAEANAPDRAASAAAQASGGARTDEGDHHHGDRDSEEQAVERLPEKAREAIKQALEKRDEDLKAKLAKELAATSKKLKRDGADQVGKDASGNQTVTSSFTLSAPDGQHQVSVTRTLAPDGTLLQSVQQLSGAANGGNYTATRTKAVNADGSVTLTSKTTVTSSAGTQSVNWTRDVQANGSYTASGTVTAPDGSVVQLSGSGTEGGQESISGDDGKEGLKLNLTVDATTGVAQASVDAGAAGRAAVTLAASEERDAGDDEGDGRDDQANATGTATATAHADGRDRPDGKDTPDASRTAEPKDGGDQEQHNASATPEPKDPEHSPTPSASGTAAPSDN